MMNRHHHIGRALLLIVGLLLGTVAAPTVAGLAEEMAGPHIVVLGITEGPDPIGLVQWVPIADVSGHDGAWSGRSDGRPDVYHDPETGYPVAVWSYGVDDKFDIVFSRWDGSSWRELEFLAESPADELDPRISFDQEGDGYLIWWQGENGGTVYLSELNTAAGGDWSAPRAVASQAQRPSIVTWIDRMMIVFERPTANGTDIVLHQEFGGAGFHQQIVAKSSAMRGDAIIHRSGSTIWIDWLAQSGLYEWAEMSSGGFRPAGMLGWADRTWQGDQNARSEIRSQVLAGR